jgi:molecular chaperone DnaJ
LRTPSRGDVIVTIEVETPHKLDERQQELLRELAELRHEESPDGRIQPAQKGVFGRLRDAFNPR